jgi:hypothetical protein
MHKNIIVVISILFLFQPFVGLHVGTAGMDVGSPKIDEAAWRGTVVERSEREISHVSYNDTDGNRIDDLIDWYLNQNPEMRFSIFVNYYRPVTELNINDLAKLHLTPTFVSKYINSIILEDMGFLEMKAVLLLRDVIGIENAPSVHPMLDTSVRSVKARESDIYSPVVWNDLGLTGTNVNVAIIDSGVDDIIHAGLRGKFVGGVDTTSSLGQVERNPDDGIGHGTHCAGIIMGTGNGGDNIGVAPNASLVDCRVGDVITLGSATMTNFMEALEWVKDNAIRHNISVLSISMGTSHSTDGNDASSRLANEVVDSGVTVVVAIGNDDNGHNANIVSSPGSADKVITVGAIHDRNTVERNDDTIAGYSQRGPRPSDGDNDDMDELKPDLTAPGSDIASCMHNTLGSYVVLSGTSMATPHVSGVAALMKEAYPALKPLQIKDILRRSAQSKGGASYPNKDGKYNTKYGWGMIDAYGAVRRASDMTSPEMNIPAYVDSGSRLNIRAAMDLARTSVMESPDNLEWGITFPDYFAAPNNISITTGINAETVITWDEPYKENGEWHLDIHVEISGGVGDLVEVAPELVFFTTAPHVGQAQQFTFLMNTSVNGIFSPERTSTMVVGDDAEYKPDLTITPNDITFSENPASTGQEIVIYANVTNVGLSDTHGVIVEFYDGNPASGILIGSNDIDVPRESTRQANVEWVTTSGTLHNIFVAVDPEDIIDETFENNNTASKPLAVLGGINREPTSSFTAKPNPADVNEVVSFKGHNSNDPDGTVTEWKFFFGDGTDSGWLPVSYTDHSYPVAGTYSASLVVKDNGGKESTNNDSKIITVKELAGGNMGFYLISETNLSLSRPEGIMEHTRPCPDGYTPFPFPGSPVGRVEYREIGTWQTSFPLDTRELVERGTVTFWIRNVNDGQGYNAQFRTIVRVNGEILIENETDERQVEPGSPPLEIEIHDEVSDFELKYRSTVEISLEVKVNGNGLELVYGAQKYPSGFTTKYLPVKNNAPKIIDAPDVQGWVDDEIVFIVNAEDGHGEIVSYRWDVDNDLEWDIETVANETTFIFEIADEYRINVIVVDDDGATTTDHFTAFINAVGESLPPEVLIEFPGNGTILSGMTMFRGSASDDRGIVNVLSRIDNEPFEPISEDETWEVEVDIDDLVVGEHVFSVMARDTDGQESPVESILFYVVSTHGAPFIKQVILLPEKVNNSGKGQFLVTVYVDDPDGPEDIESVTLDLAEIGLGEKKCELERVGVYGRSVTIPQGTPPGTRIIFVTVRDAAGLENKTNVTVTVVEMNHPPYIEDLTEEKRISLGKPAVLRIMVRVTDENGKGDISSVRIDLTPLEDDSIRYLNDDGVFGDDIEGDGIYTLEYKVPKNAPSGTKRFVITAEDRGGEVAYRDVSITFSKPNSGDAGKAANSEFYDEPIFFIGVILAAVLVILYISTRKFRK